MLRLRFPLVVEPAAGGTPGNASGDFVTLVIDAAAGSATGKAAASGSLPTLPIEPPGGSAKGKASASGGFPSLVVVVADGSAKGKASASGGLTTLVTIPFDGSAVGGTSVPGNASGSFVTLAISPFGGSAGGAATASGTLGGPIELLPPAGAARGAAAASGSFVDLVITPMSGVGSVGDDVIASGSLGGPIVIEPFNGYAFLGNSFNRGSFSMLLTDDFDIFDEVETITYKSRTLTGTETTYSNVKALRRSITGSQASTGGQGVAILLMATWHIKATTLPVPPKKGDRIVSAASGTWEVLTDDVETLGNRYSCHTRKIV